MVNHGWFSKQLFQFKINILQFITQNFHYFLGIVLRGSTFWLPNKSRLCLFWCRSQWSPNLVWMENSPWINVFCFNSDINSVLYVSHVRVAHLFFFPKFYFHLIDKTNFLQHFLSFHLINFKKVSCITFIWNSCCIRTLELGSKIVGFFVQRLHDY